MLEGSTASTLTIFTVSGMTPPTVWLLGLCFTSIHDCTHQLPIPLDIKLCVADRSGGGYFSCSQPHSGLHYLSIPVGGVTKLRLPGNYYADLHSIFSSLSSKDAGVMVNHYPATGVDIPRVPGLTY